MRVIYEPSGRAAEYADLAVNLYRGCGHACDYCYAPKVLRMAHREFWDNPKPRKDILKKFERDCQELADAGDTRKILLCFTTDPYQPIEQEYNITGQAIDILNNYGLNHTILTKGGNRIVKDLPRMRTDLCDIGTTLVFSDNASSVEHEPNAEPTSERIDMLCRAKSLGFRTWVSLEPVWNPMDVFALMKLTHTFVDEYRIGKLNYHPHAKTVDWKKFKHNVVKWCEDLGVNYILKKDLEVL